MHNNDIKWIGITIAFSVCVSTEADELITRLGRIQEDNEGSLVAARADRWVDQVSSK